jgi:hypothetical protein
MSEMMTLGILTYKSCLTDLRLLGESEEGSNQPIHVDLMEEKLLRKLAGETTTQLGEVQILLNINYFEAVFSVEISAYNRVGVYVGPADHGSEEPLTSSSNSFQQERE